MKNSLYACYCCGMHRDNMAMPNNTLCADCIRLNKRVCYHHVVTDEAMLEQMREESIQLQQDWPHLSNFLFLQSRTKVGDVGIGNGELNPTHINFRP